MFRPSAPDKLLQAYLQNKRDLAAFDAKRDRDYDSVRGMNRPVLDVDSVARGLGFFVRHITVSGVDKTQVSYDGKRWTDFEDFVLNHEAQVKLRLKYYTQLVGSDESSKSYEEVHGTSKVHALFGIADDFRKNFDFDELQNVLTRIENSALMLLYIRDHEDHMVGDVGLFEMYLNSYLNDSTHGVYVSDEEDVSIVEKLARFLKEAKGELH